MKHGIFLCSFFFFFLFPAFLKAQLEIVHSKTLGNGKSSVFDNIAECPDNGYLIVGANLSKGAPVTCGSAKDTMRFWLVKLDSNMNTEWQRCYGKDYGNMDGRLKFIESDGRGGYVLFGEIDIEKKKYLPCYHGTQDLYLLHIDSLGNVLQERCYGGGGFEISYDFHRTRDGGYIVGSGTLSDDGDLDSNGYVTQFTTDAWIFKLDSLFDIEWSLQWGGYGDDDAHVVVEAESGGYYAAVASSSYDGDVDSNFGFDDFWLLRLDDTGGVRWQRHYGGNNSDQIRSLIPDGKGHLYIGGYSKSSFCTSSSDNYWVLKTDTLGKIIWEKCYGGRYSERMVAMRMLEDKLYLSGLSRSDDGDVGANYGADDLWLLVIDKEGKKLESRNFGGSNWEFHFSMHSISDKLYAIGASESTDYDLTNKPGGKYASAWLMELRLRPVGIGAAPQASGYYLGDNIPNPFEGSTRIPYRVPADAEARLIIYDTHGKTVLSLPLKSGKRQITVNCSTWPSGIYLYTLYVNGKQVASNKMTLLK